MKPRARPVHDDSQAGSGRFRGVKDAWMVLLLLAGITWMNEEKARLFVIQWMKNIGKQAARWTYYLLRRDAEGVIGQVPHMRSNDNREEFVWAEVCITVVSFRVLKPIRKTLV